MAERSLIAYGDVSEDARQAERRYVAEELARHHIDDDPALDVVHVCITAGKVREKAMRIYTRQDFAL